MPKTSKRKITRGRRWGRSWGQERKSDSTPVRFVKRNPTALCSDKALTNTKFQVQKKINRCVRGGTSRGRQEGKACGRFPGRGTTAGVLDPFCHKCLVGVRDVRLFYCRAKKGSQTAPLTFLQQQQQVASGAPARLDPEVPGTCQKSCALDSVSHTALKTSNYKYARERSCDRACGLWEGLRADPAVARQPSPETLAFDRDAVTSFRE